MPKSKSNENKFLSTYPIIVSTLAFIVSASSFYFANLRISHSLELGLVKFSPDDVALPCTFVVDTILLNKGNQTETLLNAELVLTGGDRVTRPSSRKGPLVLKSGDAVPLRIEFKLDKLTFESGAKWSGDDLNRKAEFDIALEASAVNPNGKEIKTTLPLGKLLYDEPSGVLEFKASAPKEINLIELLR